MTWLRLQPVHAQRETEELPVSPAKVVCYVLPRLLALCAVAGLATGCASAPPAVEAEEPAAEMVEPSELTWDPSALVAATPALLGWRAQPSGGGELCVLSSAAPMVDPVVWRTPDGLTDGTFEVIGIAPDGMRMVGAFYADAESAHPATSTLLFDESGRARELAPPEGYDAFSDVAFVPGGLLAIAYRADPDDYRTVVGLIAADGQWQPLTILGEFPEYQTVEVCATRPGSDVVSLVLKLPPGAGTRDDAMLVQARVGEGVLRVITPPFYDDALTSAQPLLDADGVAYPRLWQTPADVLAPSFVRIEWGGVSWVERHVLPAGVAVISDGDDAVVSDGSGGVWVRTVSELQVPTLLYLPPSGGPVVTGTDLTSVGWFGWVQGPAR